MNRSICLAPIFLLTKKPCCNVDEINIFHSSVEVESMRVKEQYLPDSPSRRIRYFHSLFGD